MRCLEEGERIQEGIRRHLGTEIGLSWKYRLLLETKGNCETACEALGSVPRTATEQRKNKQKEKEEKEGGH